MKVLYIVLNDLGRKDSGSGVRPNCMLEAFRERGHEVYVFSGSQGVKDGKTRKAGAKNALKWVKENKPDFCYIESSTYPIIHSCDYRMIRYLTRKKIPTSYFYRDIYRILPINESTRRGLANKIKDFGLNLLQKYTDLILHKIDVVYFPSERFTKYFNYKRMELLPPAGQVCFPETFADSNTCLYCGGVSDFYGFPLIMDAFQILNKDELRYKLILVCREKEFRNAWGEKELPAWLEVHHASGDALVELYRQSDIGLLALHNTEYANLCIGIKLFQYVGYGLPVLSTDVYTMGKIITENGFGEVSQESPEDYAAAIERMLSDRDKLNGYRKTMKESMQAKHLWVHRIDKIVEDMTGVKS